MFLEFSFIGWLVCLIPNQMRLCIRSDAKAAR
jgi:hypothetical protein